MSGIAKLLEVMSALRDPQTGCPWDQQQDFSTIAPYTIEEAYEVADAIARNDMRDLQDELGDLLFQVVFHARMAEEAGQFDFDDVARGISDKMQRRHPHVFAGEPHQPGSWEKIKSAERSAGEDDSAVAGVAKALPALKRAEKLGNRASRVGFDWPDSSGVRAKIHEELDELDEAIGTRDPERVEEEFGDMLFAVVNLARHLDVDPEKALSRANFKFEGRFREMESALREQGVAIESQSLASLDKEWRAAKARLKNS